MYPGWIIDAIFPGHLEDYNFTILLVKYYHDHLLSDSASATRQPLILGYLLGGVLVGPNLGLELVHSHESVAEIANLGLVFLLFMIGLLGYGVMFFFL